MNLPQTINPALTKPIGAPAKTQETSQDPTIVETFENMLQDTNDQLISAEAKQEEFATSSNKDIHGTMIEMEKAEVSMRLLLQVRSKLTTAYEEIMRMQV